MNEQERIITGREQDTDGGSTACARAALPNTSGRTR